MPNIDAAQYRILKRLHKKGPIQSNHILPAQKSDYGYLLKCGYITEIKQLQESVTVTGKRPVVRVTGYEITAEGRAERYDFKATFYKWWIPVVISIIALIVSIIALLAQLLT